MRILLAALVLTFLSTTANAACGPQPIAPGSSFGGQPTAQCVCDAYGRCDWFFTYPGETRPPVKFIDRSSFLDSLARAQQRRQMELLNERMELENELLRGQLKVPPPRRELSTEEVFGPQAAPGESGLFRKICARPGSFMADSGMRICDTQP